MGLGTVLSGHKGMFGMVLGISKFVKKVFGIGGLEWRKMGKMIICHNLTKWAVWALQVEHNGPVGICFGPVQCLVEILTQWW